MKCTSSGSRSKGCATQFLAMRESPGSIEMGRSVTGMAAFGGQMYKEYVSKHDAISTFTVQLGAEQASLSCQNIDRLAKLQVLFEFNEYRINIRYWSRNVTDMHGFKRPKSLSELGGVLRCNRAAGRQLLPEGGGAWTGQMILRHYC